MLISSLSFLEILIQKMEPMNLYLVSTPGLSDAGPQFGNY